MNLSRETVEVLKNFATINPSILVSEGNQLSTIAIAKNVIADATVAESFPQEFAIYNLNEFLSAVSLFQNPSLEFNEKFVQIREKDSKRGGIKYFYTNKSLITYPTKKLQFPEADVTFNVTEEMLSKIQKAGAVLGMSDVAIVGGEDGVSIVVLDKKNTSSNDFEILVSEEVPDEEFKFFLKLENLKIIPGNYKVEISAKGLTRFSAADGSKVYAVALER